MDTTPQPPPSGAQRSPRPSEPDTSLLAAAPTLMGITMLAGPSRRMPLDLEQITTTVYPGERWKVAASHVETHILRLEEANYLQTGIGSDGREWVAIAPSTPPFSPAVGESARASESGRERAGERERERPPRPRRPWQLDAPPIGCPEHPTGSLFPCGPCQTARLRHERWMVSARYEAELARYEGTTAPPGPPRFDEPHPEADTLFSPPPSGEDSLDDVAW